MQNIMQPMARHGCSNIHHRKENMKNNIRRPMAKNVVARQTDSRKQFKIRKKTLYLTEGEK